MVEGTFAQSFEETCKQSYSHGLETIYALENVDLRSIRRFSAPVASCPAPKQATRNSEEQSDYFEFDFGKGFRGWLEPCIFNEPIQVLELARYTEKILLENGKKRLSHLRSIGIIKGFGQGHFEEIRTKLGHYLKGKALLKTSLIDYGSLLRSLIGDVLRKKMAACLEFYDMDVCVPLLPSEKMELRRLSTLAKREWVNDAIKELQKEERVLMVNQKVQEIATELIIPWLRGRDGIATKDEILEILEQMTLEPEMMDASLHFLGDVYYAKQFPLACHLYEACPEIYCADKWHYQAFQEIVTKAKTYFYKRSVRYHLPELAGWLEREFAKKWIGFPPGMLEKVLRLSSEFCIRKNITGQIEISAS